MAKQTFQDYCLACSNYATMYRFVTSHYFCRSCLARIRQALRKAQVDWTTSNLDRPMIERIVNQVVEAIQSERDGDRKTTRKTYELARKRWRVKKNRHK